MAKKKKTKRSQTKNPNLKKNLNSRVRQEYIDMDYVDKLDEKQKEFLNKFTGEFYGGAFDKNENDEYTDDNLMKTDAERKEMWNNNNARNRCLYGKIKNKVGNTHLLNFEKVKNMVEDEFAKNLDPDTIEDAIIDFIDSKKSEDSD